MCINRKCSSRGFRRPQDQPKILEIYGIKKWTMSEMVKYKGSVLLKRPKSGPVYHHLWHSPCHWIHLFSRDRWEWNPKVMFQHLKIECFCWPFLTISCKKDTTKPKTKFLSVVKVKQFRNDFFKPTFLPKNERRNSTSLLVDLISFVFWKKVKTPKRLFEINWPLSLNHL